MHKSVVEKIGNRYVGVNCIGKSFNKTLSAIDNLPDSLNKVKQAALLASPELALCLRLKETDRSVVDTEVLALAEEMNLDLNKLTVYISTVEINKQKESLLVMINQDKLANIFANFSDHGTKLVGLLPEPIAVHKIVEAEITPEETQLVLHVGEKNTQIYLLDKYGPVKTYPEAVTNEELIPVVQKFIKWEEYCGQGIYFGKRSLSFDQKLFEEQTKVRLNNGVESLKRFSKNLEQDISNVTNLQEHVPVLAAVLGYEEKDLLGIDRKLTKSIGVNTTKRGLPWKEILLGLLVAAFTVFLVTKGVSFVNKKSTDITRAKVETVTSPTSVPEPTAVIKAEDIKIRVLNGSGTPGEAGIYAGIMKEAKFKVVEVGNAPTFDFVTSQVRYKKGEEAKLNMVVSKLENEVTSRDTLDQEDEVDIEIIVGGS